jgi:hypothetical protein
MTAEQIKNIIEHPFMNFSAIARATFPGDEIAEQKLRGRVFSVEQLSDTTVKLLTPVLREFAELFAEKETADIEE